MTVQPWCDGPEHVVAGEPCGVYTWAPARGHHNVLRCFVCGHEKHGTAEERQRAAASSNAWAVEQMRRIQEAAP